MFFSFFPIVNESQYWDRKINTRIIISKYPQREEIYILKNWLILFYNALPQLEMLSQSMFQHCICMILMYGGQGSMHSVDYQVYMSSPLITHFQLLLDHLHLGLSLSLEIQHIDQNWSMWKAGSIISPLLYCLSTHPPTSHPIHSPLEILHFHESYHIFLSSVTKTLGSTLMSSSPSPVNLLESANTNHSSHRMTFRLLFFLSPLPDSY